MSLSTVTNKAAYEMLLKTDGFYSFTKNTIYSVSKQEKPAPTIAEPDPAEVTVTRYFRAVRNVTVSAAEIENILPSNDVDEYGLNYERITAILVSPDVSLMFLMAEDPDPEVALDVTVPENFILENTWDWVTSIDLAELDIAAGDWLYFIAINNLWDHAIDNEAVNKVKAYLPGWLAGFDDIETTSRTAIEARHNSLNKFLNTTFQNYLTQE